MESNSEGEVYCWYLSQYLYDFINWFNPTIDWGIVISASTTILILIFASALVSGSEVAYFSLSPQQLNKLKKKNQSVSERIKYLLEKPQILLATILIANNLFNIGIIVTYYFLINHTLHIPTTHWIVKDIISVVSITLVLVLFGEVIPKVYATQNNIRLVQLTLRPMQLLYQLLRPFSFILAKSTSFLEQRLEKISAASSQNSVRELTDAIDIIAHGQPLGQEARVLNMLKGIVNFRNITVKEIMQNRMDIFAVEKSTSFKELYQEVVKAGYSRIPVYEDNIDNVQGLLYAKDLLPHLNQSANFAWQTLLRPPLIVSEYKKIYDLLKEIQKNHIHLAIVVDEHGGVSGLITLEDILEEIVGDIQDEHDNEEELIYHKLSKNSYQFEGRTLLRDVCRLAKIDQESFTEIKGNSESLAGLLLELSKRFPQENEVITFERFSFRVVSVKDNRIEQVNLTINETNEEGYSTEKSIHES